MTLSLILLISLLAPFRELLAKSNPHLIKEELGKAVYPRKINLLADFVENEKTIFERLPSECIVEKELDHSQSKFEYYANTKAFYSKLGVGFGFGISLQSTFTLGFTLSSLFQTIKSKKITVKGMSLNVLALTQKIWIKRDCFDSVLTLEKNFLEDFEALPLTIRKPWASNSWRAYRKFLDTFGTHVIESAKLGSSIKQMTLAQSSESYSERDFFVKICTKFTGLTHIGDIGTKACQSINSSEINRVGKIETQDTLIVRGGTKKLRNALFEERSGEAVEKFMNAANESDTAVGYNFRAIWDILQSRFKYGSENYIRALNLQNYYLGYLNYGCQPLTSTAPDLKPLYLQKFDYTKASTPTSPEYSCTLAKEGCHRDDDCHYRVGVYCSCYGETCVRYKSVTKDTGDLKEIPYTNDERNWRWHGCDWKVKGSVCRCFNGGIDQRVEVWTSPGRDIVKKDNLSDLYEEEEDEEEEEEEEEEDLAAFGLQGNVGESDYQFN
ncbi:DELTA-alicitoxin-Pse2b-like [Acropora millepora]|uniref:DELTA-alicitoxin-Pse2b-like n=1 Tax=Acropora millepora TaxID=45264 RepID=UPI001CF2042F|nr:DELTA-alicitoxin-Pse2b-like [Acropora millepora]